jgi:hypothetical protein
LSLSLQSRSQERIFDGVQSPHTSSIPDRTVISHVVRTKIGLAGFSLENIESFVS